MHESTTQYLGSTKKQDCVCDKGSYYQNGQCIQCTQGMLCDEFGQSAPRQEIGFKVVEVANVSNAITYQTYRCIDKSKCPAGPQGTCAQGHTGVACAACLDEHYLTPASGDCLPCDGALSIPTVIIAIFLGLGGLVAITYAVNRDPITRSHGALSCVISAGILVSAVQTLGVFSQLSINWFEPVRTVMRLFPLLSFDPRSFKIGCFVGATPLATYATQLAIAPFCAIFIYAIIAAKKRSIASVEVMVEFLNTIGTIFKVLFISLVMSTFAPIVCYSHPGREYQSMRTHASILCFESPEHSWMFALGMVVFLIVPVPFFAAACYCTWLFPVKTAHISDSSAVFLNATRFFFAKFEPSKYYYGICMLMRSLMICLVPVVVRDNLPLQVVLIGLILGAIHLVQTQTQPWRVPLNNFIDTGLNVSMWMLMMVGAMCVGLTADLESIRTVGTIVFVMVLVLAVVSLLASGSKIFHAGPFFGYFFCHHRAQAAAQVRLLRNMMMETIGQAIYVDSDDLSELEGLLDMVKSRVGTLVAYLTQGSMRRPWCAAEITIGMMTSKCKVVVVQTQSFVPPDDDELRDLGDYLDLQSCNFEHYGITTDHVQSAYRKILNSSSASVTTIDSPAIVSGSHRFEVLAGLIVNCKSKHDAVTVVPKLQENLLDEKVVISSDHQCDEATAVVILMKTKISAELALKGIVCLCDYEEDTAVALKGIPDASAVIVLLSSGALACPQQLAVAAWASKAKIESNRPDVIPVSIPGFVVPVEEFFTKTVPHTFRTAVGVKFGFGEATEFVQALREFFWSTRTTLSTHSPDQIFESEVQGLITRMRRGPRRSTVSRNTLARIANESDRLSKASECIGPVDSDNMIVTV